MSQKHVDQMLEILDTEDSPGVYPLEAYDISTIAVLAIPDSFDLVPDELYDPVSDIEHSALGVHHSQGVVPRKCEVVGDNGRFMFCFKLSEAL